VQFTPFIIIIGGYHAFKLLMTTAVAA